MPGMNRGDINLEEIYAWIDEIQFSKPKKNIYRDFSDGVLMAELLGIYYPRLSDAHNYIPASSVAAKRENWNTLNRKVFSKIDTKLSKDVINQLANAQPGVIERVLIDLRNKISIKESDSLICAKEESQTNNQIKSDDNLIGDDADREKTENTENLQKEEETVTSEDLNAPVVKLSNSNVSETKSTKNLIGKVCGWVIGWIWPFGGDSQKSTENELSASNSMSTGLKPLEKSCSGIEQPAGSSIIRTEIEGEKENETDEGNEDADEGSGSISRLDFLRLRREVEEKNLAISRLNRKVSCLESVMKLKDRKIGNLAARISTHSTTAEAAQNLRPHVMGSSISRLRGSQTVKNHKLISR